MTAVFFALIENTDQADLSFRLANIWSIVSYTIMHWPIVRICFTMSAILSQRGWSINPVGDSVCGGVSMTDILEVRGLNVHGMRKS